VARAERRTLLQLLAINATMFVVELALGWAAESMGLVADSLDMLADAGVYGIALWVSGRGPLAKARAAASSGVLQLALAGLALLEVARRAWLQESEPLALVMVAVSLLALGANTACLWLLWKHRQGEVHMRASVIFSTTDVQANLGVITAGLLVFFTGWGFFDLVIGLAICGLVVRGGVRILREARAAHAAATAPRSPR
jgi:Co/Zn/Cd efflux system component